MSENEKEVTASEQDLKDEDLNQVTGGSWGTRIYRKVKTIVDILRDRYGDPAPAEEKKEGTITAEPGTMEPYTWRGPKSDGGEN